MVLKFKTTVPPQDPTALGTDLPNPAPTQDQEPHFEIKDFAQNYLTYHVHKNTAGEHPPRQHNRVHISDLDPAREWCPREPWILDMYGLKRPHGFTATATQIVYDFGHAGAEILRKRLPAQMVWGNWKCRACSHVHTFSYTPDHCLQCHGNREALDYQEVVFQCPSTGVTGSVDLFVDLLGNGMKTGIECKTEGNEDFGKRNKAQFDHEWRSMGYLYLMHASGLAEQHGLNTKEMRVVYLTKEGYKDLPALKTWGVKDWAKSPIKEYFVNRNDDMITNQLQKVSTYKAALNSNVVPDRIKKCSSIGCSRAKQCPVKTACWQDFQ